jgi:hypothetical protein
VATLEQRGSILSVRLSGAEFIVSNGRGDHFDGFVDPDGRITFTIGDPFNYYYYYYYYFYGGFTHPTGIFDLVERLDTTSALVVTGTVRASSSGSVISGDLNGTVALTRGVVAPYFEFSTFCSLSSSSSRFRMRRQ